MTDQNRGHAIDEEMSRADDALKAADLLDANELFSDSVSRPAWLQPLGGQSADG